MIVDAHAHIIVPEILRDAAPVESWRPDVIWQEGQQIIEFAGKQLRSAVREFVQIEQILECQAEAGIDFTVLSPWVSILGYEKPPKEGLRTSRIQNDSLARIVQQHPNHVAALGTVPLQSPELAAEELRVLMGESGIIGVEVAASVNGDYLGHERFAPFWAAAEATGAVIFIHPTTRGFDLPVLNEFYLWNSVGNPMETAVTAAHMIMAGVMERYPNLKAILAHGGGALLALRGRLRHAHSFQPQARAKLTDDPDASLKRFYYDSLTHDPALLRALIEYAGEDHVLLASDYPFDMGDSRPIESVRAAGLSESLQQKILSENAIRLLGLKAR